MEVGDECLDALELVAGIYEDARVAFLRTDVSVFVRHRFQRTHACRADANHSASFPCGFVYLFGVFFVDFVIFGVHLVVENVLFLDGTERS